MARCSGAAALLLAACLAAVAVAVHADDVIVVTGAKELEALVKQHPFLVVEFYAPWCGHCKKLEPEWTKAAAALKGNDPPIVLAKVDVTQKENEELKTKFGIKGFPTIKVFKGDVSSPSEYSGPREHVGIVKHLKKQVMPAYVKLESKDAVDAAIKDADVLVLAYLDSEDGAEFKTFAAVSDALRNDMDFAYVSDHSLVEACASDCASPFVVMHKAGEAEVPRYLGDFTATELLKTWAAAKSLPLVIKFGSESGMKHLQKAFAGTSPRLIVVTSKESPELLEQLQQASKANDDLAIILAMDDASGKRLVDYYGIKAGGKTVLLMENPKAAAKYLKADVKPSDVPEFIREFQEGALEKWIKSEEPPADNSGPVRILTAKTFDEDVFKSDKDVFIEFYAPWCGHCKKLAPIWDEIGAELKGDAGVVIAKMDSTLNDIPTPKMTVKGFPTLYFVTAKGDVIAYSGDRSKTDLVKFIKDKRTTAGDGAAAAADEDDVEEEDEGEEEAPKDEL